MKKKNIILLIIAIVMFILVGSTMAYFGWSSSVENKDQLVDVTVAGGTGSCDKLSDNNKLLYPTSTREKGRILKVTTKQQMATNAFVTWNLVVNSINETTLTTSGLKHKSFKYELVNDTTGVSYGTGSFENVTNGTTITLSTDKETLDYNKEYTFILYLWIDGTIGNNPLDMTNQPYNFDLNCNITGTSIKIVPTDTYQLTNGDGTTYTSTYTGSGTKAVRSTAPLSKFREVRVDDTVVASSNYTLTEGSTIVTFKESYLKTLSKGEHTLKVVSTDGLTSGTITVKDPVTIATYITDLYTNATKATATNNSINYNIAPAVSLMNDRLGDTKTSIDGGNIRYYGANPNNYVYYNCTTYPSTNCELWRIIGVFDGKVKIIRNEALDSIAFDNDEEDTYLKSLSSENVKTSAATMEYNNYKPKVTLLAPGPTGSGQNDYANSSLRKILNYYYYNSINYSGKDSYTFTSTGLKNDTTRKMIASSIWYLSENSVILLKYSNFAYKYERYDNNTWTGNIAIIYPSDYGYAASFGDGKNSLCTSMLNSYNDTACLSNNWLKSIIAPSTYGWTLGTRDKENVYGILVASDGKAVESNFQFIYESYSVAPTLYLNSNILLSSGSGSKTDPYKLSA